MKTSVLFCWALLCYGSILLWDRLFDSLVLTGRSVEPLTPFAWDYCAILPMTAFALLQAICLFLVNRRAGARGDSASRYPILLLLSVNCLGFAVYAMAQISFHLFVLKWVEQGTLPLSSMLLHTGIACVVNTLWAVNGMKRPGMLAIIYGAFAIYCGYVQTTMSYGLLPLPEGYALFLIATFALLVQDHWATTILVFRRSFEYFHYVRHGQLPTMKPSPEVRQCSAEKRDV